MSDPRKPLFPDDDDEPVLPEESLPDEPDADAAATPDDSPEAMDDGEVVETPPEERFPPLNLADEPPPADDAPAPRRRPVWLLNLVTIFFALATIALLVYFGLLWSNPYHPLNPLPPYTPLPVIVTATFQPATATPIPSATESPTPATTATFTPIPADALPATMTFTPAAFPFTLADAGVDYAENGNDSGCAWASIAGNVVDLQGDGVVDYSVRIRSQEGDLNATVATGAAPDFGPGGYELQLGDQPELAPYVIQLLSPDGSPLSEEYLVVSSDQCDQNVAVVDFVQNR
jgi:hypothetical protein